MTTPGLMVVTGRITRSISNGLPTNPPSMAFAVTGAILWGAANPSQPLRAPFWWTCTKINIHPLARPVSTDHPFEQFHLDLRVLDISVLDLEILRQPKQV